MTEQNFNINGRDLSIRFVDTSYIMCDNEKASGVSVEVHCRSLSPCWPNPLYAAYYRKILAEYNIGPVLVWEGKRIVGFLPASVIGCGIPELPHCVHYTGGLEYGAEKHIDLSMVEKAKTTPFDELSPKEIRLGCMTVHPSLQGKGFGALMIEFMIEEARSRGWERVRARPMLDNEPHSFYPTVSFWKKLGFEPVGPVRTFGPGRNSYDRSKAVEVVFELKK